MTNAKKKTHYAEPTAQSAEARDEEADAANTLALELCFIAVVGLIVAAAFFSALRYDIVSARAPLLVMVPLLILIGAQFIRSKIESRGLSVKGVWSRVIEGEHRNFNRAAGFLGWMLLLLALMSVAGHYVGCAVVMFILLRIVAKETLLLSVAITVGVTATIFVLFEYGFDIKLHRGVVYRFLNGYTS